MHAHQNNRMVFCAPATGALVCNAARFKANENAQPQPSQQKERCPYRLQGGGMHTNSMGVQTREGMLTVPCSPSLAARHQNGHGHTQEEACEKMEEPVPEGPCPAAEVEWTGPAIAVDWPGRATACLVFRHKECVQIAIRAPLAAADGRQSSLRMTTVSAGVVRTSVCTHMRAGMHVQICARMQS